jgi:hypothetical protein
MEELVLSTLKPPRHFGRTSRRRKLFTSTRHCEGIAAKMVQKTVERDFEDQKKKHTLGSLRLRHHESNQIILIPTPTNDPNGKHGELTHRPEATNS